MPDLSESRLQVVENRPRKKSHTLGWKYKVKEKERVIYSLNIEDVQNVAIEEYGRTLTDEELEIIEEELGDYIDWYDSIDAAISFHLKLSRKNSNGTT